VVGVFAVRQRDATIITYEGIKGQYRHGADSEGMIDGRLQKGDKDPITMIEIQYIGVGIDLDVVRAQDLHSIGVHDFQREILQPLLLAREFLGTFLHFAF
jgi:hypothetical protein